MKKEDWNIINSIKADATNGDFTLLDVEETQTEIQKQEARKSWDNFFKNDLFGARNFIAQKIIEDHHVFTDHQTQRVWNYKAGIYVQECDQLIKEWMKKMCADKYATIINVKEIHFQISNKTMREDTQEPENEICVGNGILNLTTCEFSPFTPDKIFYRKIPTEYDPHAKPRLTKKFLREVVDETDAQSIEELAGFCLYKRYHIHRAFMFVGGGKNGKSTCIELLKAFLGEENCASVSLQALDFNRFAPAALQNKLANLYPDLSARALRQTGIFKILTGEDTIGTERKGVDFFSFKNHAKMVFSCNRIPKVEDDDSNAFFRRWCIIKFDKTFSEEEADKHLIKKLTEPRELSGFLNLAIEGLQRLHSRGEFANAKDIDEVRKEYIKLSDSVGSFVMDMLEFEAEGFIPKQELYSAYTQYCRNERYPPESEVKFKQSLQNHIRILDYRASINGLRVICWKGIKWQDDIDEHVKGVKDVKGLDIYSSIVRVPKGGSKEKTLDTLDRVDMCAVSVAATKEFIRHHPDCSLNDLFEHFGIDHIETIPRFIEKLKRDGQIFEPAPDRWRILT